MRFGEESWLDAAAMTNGRLGLMIGLFLLGAAMAGIGATNPRLTELLYVFWIPEVLGVLVLVTAPKRVKLAASGPGAWSSEALQTLGRTHGFTPAHLDANRAGRLHPEQVAAGIARGNIDIGFGKTMLALGAVLLIAGFLVPFFPRALKDFDFTFALPVKPAGYIVGLFFGGILGTLPLLFGGVALKYGRSVVRAFEAGKVLAVAGPVKPMRIRKRRGLLHYYVVNDRVLLAPRDGFDHVKAGAAYRFYFVPERNELVSLEPA